MTEREKLIVAGLLPDGFMPQTRDEAYLMLAMGLAINVPAEEDEETEATEISITETKFFPPLKDWELAVAHNAGSQVDYPQRGSNASEEEIPDGPIDPLEPGTNPTA